MKFKFQKILSPENISPNEWSSWQWQMRNSARTLEDFKKWMTVSDSETAALNQWSKSQISVRSTPYYLSLMNQSWTSNFGSTESDTLRKIVMPDLREQGEELQSFIDPLGEQKHSPVSRIIHRYSDRVLLLVTDLCSVYCRFCTRKHFTAKDNFGIDDASLENALKYIASKPGIREVILSGGDPLTLSDERLDKVLKGIRAIEHVEIIRIGSRMPVVCPMRITSETISIIRKYKPVFLMTHFNHPRELTEEAALALEMLVDNGIPTFNQMVFLNGVNNHPAIVQALCRRLLFLRVKPYYMFQCDPSEGTDHLRTSIDNSLAIQKELWGHLSGLAMPNLSLDIPGGGGKVPLVPNFETEQHPEFRAYKGWDDFNGKYLNPPSQTIMRPIDFEAYLPEWETLKLGRF